MKILVVSTHDSRGGAGKAAYRFSKEFINQGHKVCLYVKESKEKDTFIKTSNTPRIISKVFHFLDYIPGYIFSGLKKEPQFTLGLFGESLERIVREFKPDVINIHWTWKGFVSFPEICRVSKLVPVVWTMHDYSPFASGVFYPYQGNIHSLLLKILVGFNSKIRKQYFKGSNIYFVSPSEFLRNEFKRLNNLGCKNIKTINNGIDSIFFHKLNKNECKSKYNLEEGKRHLLFGAINLLDNQVKGGEKLIEALRSIEKYLVKNNIGLVSFGSQDPFTYFNLSKRIKTDFVGFVKSDKEMSELINACDVMLVPSMCENYPFVVLESLACSIPVVAFEIGGIPEMIKNGGNGYLVRPFSIRDFSKKIKLALEKNYENQDTKKFDITLKAREYINLFEDLIK